MTQRQLWVVILVRLATLSVGLLTLRSPLAGREPDSASVPTAITIATVSTIQVFVAPPASTNQPGGTAIRPQTMSIDPTLPSFTAADVRAYVSSHPHPDQAIGSAPATIAGMEFLSA